ncbi:isochorismatase family protein [Spirillospora sp. CA-253888]
MINVDPRRTVLVLIDLMDRMVTAPLAPRSGVEVLDASVALAERFQGAGAPVVAVRVERPGVAEQPPGSDLADQVAALADAVVVKRTVGAFHGTGLHDLLQRYGAGTLVLAGIATNMGVESTGRAADDHGYATVYVEDAMSAFSAEEHRAAVTLDLPRFGEVVQSADLEFGEGG